MYQQIKSMFGNSESLSVKRLLDNALIPFDPANIDYQAYLKWLADGNTPEPADEPVVVPEPEFIEYQKPIIAPDFIVQTPDVPADPATALTEAIKEARKIKGTSKSLAFILLALVNYIEDVEKRLKKAKV